jgi:hypothetical protein
MRLFTIAILCLSGPLFAVEADPAKLKPTAEQIARAEAIAVKLGSPIYAERDSASRELAALGRLALGVIERVLAETDDAEVRSRCEALRPAMAAADLKAKLAAFVADADGKFDHKLPGWDKFHAITSNTAESRSLYAQMMESAAAYSLIAKINATADERNAAIVIRRTEIYNKLYGRVQRINGAIATTADRGPPPLPDLAAQFFVEAVHGTITEKRYAYALTSVLAQPSIRDTVADATKGALVRKLINHWCDTRTESSEMYMAMTLASSLNHADVPMAKYALKILDSATALGTQKAYALTTLAKSGDLTQIATFQKYMKDETVVSTAFVNANGQVERTELQLRDVALVMSLLMLDQKVEDYGFQNRYAGNANIAASSKFMYQYYRLNSPETRTTAFQKWTEYLDRNPLPKK